MSGSVRENSIMIADLAYDKGRRLGSKIRPVFVVRNGNQKITYYKITSQFSHKPEYLKSMYFEIKDWLSAGLRQPSWIDTVALRRVEEQYVVVKFVGYLSARDEARFIKFLSNQKS
ncbi:hypothetical protein OZX56_08465 [Lactobacillus sp. ESL0684]|uniref:hypothetical protein n=1 Tax=Lactobacillus sp. ESL0684 TaxID=2983213 RepID=UPI0023FA1DF3|nr:hypothetical protein [Lactobacillus sp. ESL0684]WEV43521.1 hypothetical protein OZX56_08465 [Lactobacillus sp. ESL0684]